MPNSTKTMTENPEIDLARKFVWYTNRNVFLTGKAGTGKTTFLQNLKVNPVKRTIVVAPTGVAAINAGGVTIHSFFQLPFGPILTKKITGVTSQQRRNEQRYRFSKTKINIIRTLDLLVIDEISMVRADVLDGIDEVLRRYRRPDLPFGGVQLLLIGDLQQLPPVVKKEEWELLKSYYDTFYFFSSHALADSKPVNIELKTIFRQQDEGFIRILNEIRDDRLTPESLQTLNERFHPSYLHGDNEGYITLTTHNAGAENINHQKLARLGTQLYAFEAEVQGDFPPYNYPAPATLQLKEGAQVMFLKNDASYRKQYYNGKIGVVTELDEEHIEVSFPGENERVEVEKEEWRNIQYTIHPETKNIEEKEIGKFIQYPLKLAWAITIHKSQGLTFDKAVIDAHAAFAHGQTYVALSRCKTLEGLRLSTPLSSDAVICDPMVRHFNSKVAATKPDSQDFAKSRRAYQQMLLSELFSFNFIEKQINNLLNLVGTNEESIQGNLKNKLMELSKIHLSHLKNVSIKFRNQCERLFQENRYPETDSFFNERISKAGIYFNDYLKNQWQPAFDKLYYESDNRAIQKSLDELSEKIEKETRQKRESFTSVSTGFELEKYLRTRALAQLGDMEIERKPKVILSDSDISHPELYQQLKTWRYQLSNEAGVALYSIVSQKSMRLIADELPTTVKQLGSIHGIGKKKLTQHGDEILQIVTDYCQKKNIPIRKDNADHSSFREKKEDTKQITFNLYQLGMDIPAISKERGLTEGTIERHLAYYIEQGKLEIRDFVREETIKTILPLIRSDKTRSLSEIKSLAGDDVTFSDLHFVISHLKRKKVEKTE